jgi:hypothetical protein
MSRMRNQFNRPTASEQVKVAVISEAVQGDQQPAFEQAITLLLGGLTLWAMFSLAIG